MIAKVFTHNRAQSVYLPADARFLARVKHVTARIRGREKIITPIENTWDHFFFNGPEVTADFFKQAEDVLHTARKE